MPLTLHELLKKGYFPRELPPPFLTRGYADALASPNAVVPEEFLSGKPKESMPCTHNLVRAGGLRRLLGIPNPVHFFRLARHVVTHWPLLKEQARMSPYSLTKPVEGTRERAIEPEHDLAERATQRAALRAQGRFILQTDISRFFPSIYTHALPWAIHGKVAAKQAHSSKTLSGTWEDKLDVYIRSGNSGQTVGIPIGPDTSRLLAEVVLSRIDAELATRHPGLRGIRYIDDYEFVTRSRSEAETVLADLQHLLSTYELALNPSKTCVTELPIELESRSTSLLRVYNFRDAGSTGQRHDLTAYFGLVFELLRQLPEEGLLKYALGRLRGIEINPENWSFFEDLLSQAVFVEPATIPQVCEQIEHYRALGFEPREGLWTETLNHVVCDRLPLGHASEAAWAMWLMKVLSLDLQGAAANAVAGSEDSVAALMGLGLMEKGHASASDLSALRRFSDPAALTESQWLLCYQANSAGWFGSGGQQRLRASSPFEHLVENNVSFFELSAVQQTSRVSSGAAGGGGGEY